VSTPAFTGNCPALFQTDVYSEGTQIRKKCGHDCFLVATVSCLELSIDHRSMLTAGVISCGLAATNSDPVSSKRSGEGEEG